MIESLMVQGWKYERTPQPHQPGNDETAAASSTLAGSD